MTDHDLATLVHEHVTRNEPPFRLDAAVAIAHGRRTVRRRRTSAAVAGVVLAVSAALVLPHLGAGTPRTGGAGVDPATVVALREYDAQQMPRLLDEHVGGVLSRSVTDLGPATFAATDGDGNRLPARYYDKASGMSVQYGATTGHSYRLDIAHARSEAEGNAERNCAADLRGGLYYSCDVTTNDLGDVITTRVEALRRSEHGWAVLRPVELRTGTVDPTDPSQDPIKPGRVWFQREVKAVHSETFLSYASETVRADTPAAAAAQWRVPAADLVEIATDPVLVIPKPPLGAGGCPWTLPRDQTTCSKAR